MEQTWEIVGICKPLVNASFFESGEDQENIVRDVSHARTSQRHPDGSVLIHVSARWSQEL